MNVESRAQRILTHLVGYVAATDCILPTKINSDGSLGKLICCYANPGEEDVFIFSEGVAWVDHLSVVEIFYQNILKISAEQSKSTKHIHIKTNDDCSYFMPVVGARGKFLDSMEMLRFLDRIVSDLNK